MKTLKPNQLTPASGIYDAPGPQALLDHFHEKGAGAVISPDGEALVLMADLLRT